jgi:hypothetical protein
MGCDWYDCFSVCGKGTVSVVTGYQQGRKIFECFPKDAMKETTPGVWEGTRCDDISDDDSDAEEIIHTREYIMVEFEKIYCKTELSVPGPYEITSDWRKVMITKGDDGMVMVSGTTSY